MERFFIVTYDVSDPKRWRRVFTTMKGFGAWLQLSVFQCILSPLRLKRMEYALRKIIKEGEDHVLIIDLGPAASVKPRFTSLGKGFEILERKPTIV